MKKIVYSTLTFSIFLIAVSGFNGCGKHDQLPPAFTYTNSVTVSGTGDVLASIDNTVSISIPAGAITAGTVVSIETTDGKATNGIGNIYKILPEGLTFAKPVALSFQTTADVLAHPVVAAAFKNSSGVWEVNPNFSVDQTTHIVTTNTTHFSDWSLVTTEGVALSDNAGYNFFIDAQVNTEIAQNGDTIFHITTSPLDTVLNVRLPFRARWQGYNTDEGSYETFFMMPFQDSLYHFDQTVGTSDASSVKFTETEALTDGVFYSTGSFTMPVIFYTYNVQSQTSGPEQKRVITAIFKLRFK